MQLNHKRVDVHKEKLMSFVDKIKSANPFTESKRAQRWLKKGIKKEWITYDPSFTGQMKAAGTALKGAFAQIPTPVKVVGGVIAMYAVADTALQHLDVRKGREMFEGHRVTTPLGVGRCLEYARVADKVAGKYENLALIQRNTGETFYVPVSEVQLDRNDAAEERLNEMREKQASEAALS